MNYRLWMLAIALLLTACGGGGGGGGDSTPPAITIDVIAGDDIVDDTEDQAVTLSGTTDGAGHGRPVALQILDAEGQAVWTGSATVDDADGDGSGTWSAAGADLSTLANDADYTATADVSDAAGNAAVQATRAFRVVSSFSVSGTITAAFNSYVDSDTNDPFAPHSPNDDAAEAQSVSSPAQIGGFLTYSPTGNLLGGDWFALTRDRNDYYRVALAADQVITLEIADWTGEADDPDFDLVLRDDGSGAEVSRSMDTGRYRTLVTDSAGEYLVQVEALAGTSNYLLSIGALAAEPALSTGADFVPGEVLVRFRDSDPRGVPVSVRERAASLGMGLISGADGRAVLLGFRRPARKARAFAALGISGREALRTRLAARDERMAEKFDTLRAIKALRARPEVVSADPNYIYRALATVPNDTGYAKQWHYPAINLPQAWDLTTGTPVTGDVVVAVIDTGVFVDHEDLADKLQLRPDSSVGGYDFVSDPATSNDGDGIDPDADDPGDGSSLGGSSWHGTHVAGTIAAASNNGTGVAGVSWGARIMPVRVLGAGGSGTTADVINGVRYAAGLDNDSLTTPARKADVINLSLGCLLCYSSTEEAEYAAAREAGTIIVAAAGNESTSLKSYPAAYDSVVSVSAVDLDNEPAYYSNKGPTVDVAAPGGDARYDVNNDGYPDGILSTLVSDVDGSRSPSYAFYQGTSMAAPHVAGVAALMKAVHPDLTPDDFDTLLASGLITRDLGDPGRDNLYGYGLIDAYLAVYEAQKLADSGVPAVTVTVSPSRLDFGSGTESLTLTLSQLGDPGATVTVLDVTENSDWLTVQDGADPVTGLGTYTVQVDRTGLGAGSYAALITFSYSGDTAGTLTVPVSMQVQAVDAVGDVGYLWVLLLDEDSNNVGQVAMSAEAGAYRFELPPVPAGRYYVIAGTDADNDLYICDEGEACGGYPTVGVPGVIELDADRSGVDFAVSFNADVGSVAAGAGRPQGFPRQAP